jgi:hypothetical protein
MERSTGFVRRISPTKHEHLRFALHDHGERDASWEFCRSRLLRPRQSSVPGGPDVVQTNTDCIFSAYKQHRRSYHR